MMRRFSQLSRCVALVVCCANAAAQAPKPAAAVPDDPMSRPTEYGIRFTPELARYFARQVAKNALVGHYQMDPEKKAEAAEMIARRIMETAHSIDEPLRDLIERYIEEQLDYQSREGREGRGSFMPPGFGPEFAQRLLPVLPEIRNMVRNITRDVRPMLPAASQLRMAAELMTANTFFDGFEQNMQKWASGEVTSYDDFFGRRQSPRDESGATRDLARARDRARSDLDKLRIDEWEKYLQEAKEFYGFDAAQMATAESILRESIERLRIETRSETWRASLLRNRLWQQMVRYLPDARRHPLGKLLEDAGAGLLAPVDAIEADLKRRIDDIATENQREMADEGIQRALDEIGAISPTASAE